MLIPVIIFNLLIFNFITLFNKFIIKNQQMKLNQYKQIRSKNFPLSSNPKKTSTTPTPKYDKISTFGLLTTQQPATYQIHIPDRQQSTQSSTNSRKSVILFNEHEFVQRDFNDVFSYYSQPEDDFKLTRVDQKRRVQMKERNQSEKIRMLDAVRQKIQTNSKNLLIFPVLDTQQYNSIAFQRTQNEASEITPVSSVKRSQSSEKQSGSQGIKEYQQDESLLKMVISNYIDAKKPSSIISLSILSIKHDGSLIDELDLEWLSYSKDLDGSIRDKTKLKVKKFRKQIKALQLNRQQISTWNEAQEIIRYYYQVSEYLEYWQSYQDSCNECKNGEIYQISEVEIDPEYGSIIKTIRRTYLVRINQYLPNSNLIMMRISHLLNNIVEKEKPQNIRDLPLTLFLSDCFDYEKQYQISLMSQIGTVETLKEEYVCLAMNLKVPGKHTHVKNYCDNQKIIKRIKPYAEIFVPLSKLDKELQITEKIRLNQRAWKNYEESAKVKAKSFSYETYSSFNKRKNYASSEKEEMLSSNREEANMSLIDVYGSHKNSQMRKYLNEHAQHSEMRRAEKEEKKIEEEQNEKENDNS